MEEIIEIDGERYVAVGMAKDVVRIEGENFIAEKSDGRIIYHKVGKILGVIEVKGKIYRAIEASPGKKSLKSAAEIVGKIGDWVLYGGKDKKKPPRQPRKKTLKNKEPRIPEMVDPFQNSGGFKEPKMLRFLNPGW